MHTVRQKSSEKNPDGRMRQGLGTFDKVNLVKPDKKPTKSVPQTARFRCFLAAHATITVDNPRGARSLYM